MKTQDKNFVSKFGFIMAAAGSAIGLGNIWSFPFKLGQYGGGAFLLTYLVMAFLIGIVVMIAEMFIGQRAQTNIVDSYKKVDKRVGFVGFLGLITAFIILCYYSVIGGWTVFVAGNSFNGNATSNNVNGFITFANSGIWPILLAIVFAGLAVLIISFGVVKGIEKFSKILMPILFVLLIIVTIRSLTLGEGVKDGLSFLFKPDFSKLGFEGLLAAMGQAFYSMSLGMGIMVTYGSYAKKETNLAKGAIVICLLDTAIAIVAGLAIFPAVFAFGLKPESGVALMFFTLPKVFASMGGIGKLFSFLFFSLIFLAALTSFISILETNTQYVSERSKKSRIKSTILVASFGLFVSCFVASSIGGSISGSENFINICGLDLLSFFDNLTNKFLMPFAVLLTCLTIGYMLKPKTVIEEMKSFGYSFKWSPIWSFLIRTITPVMVFLILIFGAIEVMKTPSGIITAITAVIVIALTMICYFIANKKPQKDGH